MDSYRRKISGPLSDRIDIFLNVAALSPEHLLASSPTGRSLDSESMTRHALEARERQARRWGAHLTNSRIELRNLLERGNITSRALATLRTTAERLSLSARGFARVLRVTRTIADLAGSEEAGESHLLEAIQFRDPTAR